MRSSSCVSLGVLLAREGEGDSLVGGKGRGDETRAFFCLFGRRAARFALGGGAGAGAGPPRPRARLETPV